MTTLYLIRHSEPFKNHLGINDVDDDLLSLNKKSPLSIYGEKLAEEISKNNEFNNIDVVWSSDYVRAMSTAKYFAANNNLKVNVSSKLGERKHGVSSWDELPSDFEVCQFQNENYKIGNGESRKDVTGRLLTAIYEILNNYKSKRIIIVGHATATTYLLQTWCDINYSGDHRFKDKIFFDGKWNYCEAFKLIFNDELELVDIENLSLLNNE